MLPESVYGAVIVGHLIIDWYEEPDHEKMSFFSELLKGMGNRFKHLSAFLFFDLPLILTWLVTVIVQFSLAFCLHESVVHVHGDLAADCTSTNWWLKVVALGAFVALVLDAVTTTYDMHLWLCQVDRARFESRQAVRRSQMWEERGCPHPRSACRLISHRLSHE